MFEAFERVMLHLIKDREKSLHEPGGAPPASRSQALNTAFLVSLCGGRHPLKEPARKTLQEASGTGALKDQASFFLKGLLRVRHEIETRGEEDPVFSKAVEELADWLDREGKAKGAWDVAEHFWGVFFPEGTGIRGQEEKGVRRLRQKRCVSITSLNPKPLLNPGREILFTSNVLLTVPPDAAATNTPFLSEALREKLDPVLHQPQSYWYDHPVQVGVAPENNEILYGLKGLDEAMAFEKSRGSLASNVRPVCVLSVSVTHQGLHEVARDYIKEEISRQGGFEHLRVFAFTEADSARIAREVLMPAAVRYLGEQHPAADFPRVFGVDGEYGRHYSFLKAVAPLWQVVIDPAVRATFKIDLDQVFPQEALVGETGRSVLEHFETPLWGAKGRDSSGREVELGLIAGALVNERDIHKGLFTPDTPFPGQEPADDDFIFFSALPQALSTEAEMTADYGSGELDGRKTCLQRIHVTGGTTGALIETLRKFRLFTPSFVGRAEDQAFIMSGLMGATQSPAYLHEPGLIMRHDKESFAADAIRAAKVSKIIGDYIRTLIFSYYARALEDPPAHLKDTLDPFTGCFISRLPQTLVHLRLALKALSLFENGEQEDARQLLREGAERITSTLSFVTGDESRLKNRLIREKKGWDLFHDALSALEKAIESNDGEALKLRGKARRIIRECALT